MTEPVRYVLARAAENGFFEAVVPASTAFDPLLRGSIRRRARRIFTKASAATSVTDEAHVLRLAFLYASRVAAPPPDDVENTKLAFEQAKQLVPKRGRAFWPATFTTIGVLLVASLAGAAVLWWPSPRDRFAHTALGEAMGDGLTDWTVGIGRRDVVRQDKGREEILSNRVKRQIGDGAFGLFGTALEQSKEVAGALSPEDAERATKALASTLHSLDGELAAKKLPAFIDEYTDSSSFYGASTNVWLIGYYVDQRETITIGNKSVPVLRGTRLDNLNLEIGGKAYESKALDGWVVSTDDVADWVIRNVVPALGKDRSFAFGADRAKEEGSEGRLAAKAGEKIRADLLGRAKLEATDATELGDLLVQRHTAFIRLSALGDELFEPRGLEARPKLVKALKIRKNEIDANEILRIEDRLGRFDKSFATIVEAQAALDALRVSVLTTCDEGCEIKADDEMAKAIGGSGYQGRNAAAVASKLITIARGDLPWLAFAEAEMGTGGYATVWAIERELGLSPEWMTPYGVNDEAEHGQLGVAALDKPEDAIRKAAESAYAKLFGAPMPAVQRTPGPK
ncbi:MAG TPA: hypothetical protein VGH28_18790 [Polyangiaceae bacterium]|jgi:hypothetical protein